MAYNDQLGALQSNDIIDGQFTLHRVYRHDADVATGIVPINISGIQDVSAEAMAPQMSREVFQQGGGSDSLISERNFRYSGTIRLKAGKLDDFLTAIYGKTHSTTGEAALVHRPSVFPAITLESICRADDNTTHLFSKVYQELILKPWNNNSPMEDEEVDIPFYSMHDPFLICAGAELFYDKFNGDGSTTDFTLSATPLTAVDTTDAAREDWVLDNAVFVAVKNSGDDQSTRQKSGVTLTSTTLSFTTAPAASSVVSYLGIKAY